jgi:hypothetical protein
MTFQSNHERRLLLEQALDEIDRLQDDDVVFARKPWTVASEAIIGKLDHNLSVPEKLSNQGFEYFLEASTAKEVISVFGSRQRTDQERRALLLFYAIHDAYPEWAYT